MKNIKKIKISEDLLFEISSAVLVARVRCGFTQSKLAKKVGTRQPGIARLENPTKLPTLTLLNRVAEALDQNIIFGFEPKDPNDPRFQRPKDESSTDLNFSNVQFKSGQSVVKEEIIPSPYFISAVSKGSTGNINQPIKTKNNG